MIQARLVADAIDSFAEILGRIGSVGFVAKKVSGAISVCSASYWYASIVLTSVFGRALIVLVAVHSVAGVYFIVGFRGVLVDASPRIRSGMIRSYFTRTVRICPAFDAHASFILALRLRSALCVISASFNSINFVVASEAWVLEWIVVAQAAIVAVSVFRAFLFFTFSANALANTILASFWKVDFAS